jgi:hypothetical protein
MPTAALLESWPAPELVLGIFILFGAVVGVAGGALAFARAKERLRQRLMLGALAGALTSWLVFSLIRGPDDTIRTHIFWCIVGGYAGADGILVLLKAIGRKKYL